MEKRELSSYTAGANVNWCRSLQKTVWKFIKKLKIEALNDPSIQLLDISIWKK